jgi:subtilisin family serine protease
MKKYLQAILVAGLFFSFNISTLQAQVLSSQAAEKISNLDVIENNLANRNSAPVIVILSMPYQKIADLTPGERSIQQARIEHSQDMVLEELEGLRFQNLKRFNTLPYLSLQANRDVIERLAESPNVQAIIPDQLSRPMLNESAAQIGAPIMWESGYTGTGKTVVILDTGVDIDHAFFENRIVDGACFSSTYYEDEGEPDTGDSPGVNGNGNGNGEPILYAETLCVDEHDEPVAESFGVEAGKNCDLSIDPTYCGHGTHVAGIAAGGDVTVTNSQTFDLSGIAKGADIFSIQVFSIIYDEDWCGGSASQCVGSYTSDQIKALDHISSYNQENNGELVFSSVNMSLGGELYTENCDEIVIDNNGNGTIENPIKTAIDKLRQLNIATIIASGNDGAVNAISSPACVSTAISVGAVDKSDEIASYSNSAEFLDLLAPGSNILSSIPENSFSYISGTSMAAPHVAGGWALMNQAYPEKPENYSEDYVHFILDKLKETGPQITDDRNSENIHTFSRIQLNEAASQDFLAQIASDESQQNEGWRLLSSPTITSYANLLSDVWTQGPANSNAPSVPAEESNILIFDGDAYVTVTDLSDPIPAGSGLAVYIFEDDNFDQTPNDWPKNLEVSGPPFYGDVTVDELLNPGENVFTLLGNPYSSAIKFEDFETLQIAGVVYVYDHSYEIEQSQFPLDEDVEDEDPGGAFRAWSESGVGSLTDGLIAPFQGFFVYATGSSPELTIPHSAINTEASPPFYKQQPIPSPVVKLAARINGRHASETWFSFTESGTPERNSFDAPMLYPLDYRPFLAIHSEVNGTAFNIKNLPVDFEQPLRIPVNLQAWQPNGDDQYPGYIPMSGSVELIWPKLENIPPNWTLTLVDNHNGDIINLMEKEKYRFELDTSAYKISTKPYEMAMKTVQSVTDAHSRFTLNIHPFAVTDPFVDELPQETALGQNYPNPFNPATLINFELPETSEVILDVYSIDGQRVATLVNGTRNAGMHTVTFDASNLASGVYLYRLTAAGFMQTRKMILVK